MVTRSEGGLGRQENIEIKLLAVTFPEEREK